MNALFALAVGLLVAVAVYQLMGGDMFRVVFGLYLLLNALNLLILSSARSFQHNAPLAQLEGPYADPLPQAMVLTSIVIGFGLSTFLLLITARIVRARKSLDPGTVDRWRS